MTAPASCVYRSVHLRCRPLIVAIGTGGETACSTLLDQSFGEVGGAGGFACRWKLISIAIQSRKRLCTRHTGSDPTIPAIILLTVHEDEIPHVTHALASWMPTPTKRQQGYRSLI